MRTVAAAASLVVALTGGSADVAPDIYAVNTKGRFERVNLTNDSAFDAWPATSPDERWIAFVSSRSGYEAVWVMSSDGSNPRRLTEPLGDGIGNLGSLAWSPDGRTIAFTAVLTPAGRDVRYWHYFVYTVSVAGGMARRLDTEGWGPVGFSRDGKLLAYGTRDPSHQGIGVATTGDSHTRAFANGSTAPVWAPRARRILFLDKGRHVAVTDASGRIRWTLRGFSASAAAWTRDGSVAFLAGGSRRPGLYVVRPGTQHPRHVADVADGLSLELSADSRYAAVAARGSTYVVGLAGSYFRRVGDEAATMAWSPDSNRLAFVTETVPTLTIADRRGAVQLGYDGQQAFFGIGWNGDRVLVASSP
jgi:Tol biopolymer transport system component